MGFLSHKVLIKISVLGVSFIELAAIKVVTTKSQITKDLIFNVCIIHFLFVVCIIVVTKNIWINSRNCTKKHQWNISNLKKHMFYVANLVTYRCYTLFYPEQHPPCPISKYLPCFDYPLRLFPVWCKSHPSDGHYSTTQNVPNSWTTSSPASKTS